jgi:hypothetical protein
VVLIGNLLHNNSFESGSVNAQILGCVKGAGGW